MTKGTGFSTRVLQAVNAIGGAAFDDNPRTGHERDNFFEFLNIPAFQTRGDSSRRSRRVQALGRVLT